MGTGTNKDSCHLRKSYARPINGEWHNEAWQSQAQIAVLLLAHVLLMQHKTMGLTRTFRVIKGGLSSCAEKSAMKLRKRNSSGDLRVSKVYQSISYQTQLLPDGIRYAGTECAETSRVSRKKAPTDDTIVPIVNLISDENDKGVPSQRDFVRYRLERKIQSLIESERNLLGKLSRCLEAITDEERFLDVGLKYNQWETYDQLMRRKAKLRGLREMIIDISSEQQIEEQQAKALKEKLRL